MNLMILLLTLTMFSVSTLPQLPLKNQLKIKGKVIFCQLYSVVETYANSTKVFRKLQICRNSGFETFMKSCNFN